MTKSIFTKLLFCQTALVAGLIAFVSQPASAQYTTLRNPLIPNADWTPAGSAAPEFPPPPPGAGSVPPPVTPGMGGNPGYEPWVNYVPATNINLQNTQVQLPDPSTTAEPGQMGPSITVPPPPSTPGTDPGVLAPNNSGYQPPAALVGVQSQGGLGSDQAPTQKWNGQTTQDFGRNLKYSQASGVSDFGTLLPNAPNLAKTPQYSQDGVRPTTVANGPNTAIRQPQLPGAQATVDNGMRQTINGSIYTNLSSYQAVQTQYNPQSRPVNPGPGSQSGMQNQQGTQDGSGTGYQYGDPYQYSANQSGPGLTDYVDGGQSNMGCGGQSNMGCGGQSNFGNNDNLGSTINQFNQFGNNVAGSFAAGGLAGGSFNQNFSQ